MLKAHGKDVKYDAFPLKYHENLIILQSQTKWFFVLIDYHKVH